MRTILSICLNLVLSACALSSGMHPPSSPGPEQDRRARIAADLADLHFDRLGDPVVRWDWVPTVTAPAQRPHQLLVILVDYPDRKFDRFADNPRQSQMLADWYQKQLFDDAYRRPDTLSHYYLAQSLGMYHINGRVLPPVTLSKPRSAYGRPHRPAGGDWRNDTDPEGMVEEVLTLAARQYTDFPWSDFDRWDPADFDGDGQYDEPDGYVDHFVLVFAGGGQASCQLLNDLDDVFTPNNGPEVIDTLNARQLECADRMWPHRFMVQRRESQGPRIGSVVNRRGGVPLSDSLWIRDYNMQSEYSDASTFIHEFGHSIGLPDVYSRTSNNSTGPWEVMSATADPSPQSLSAWSRIQLGWLKPQVVVAPTLGGPKSATVYLRTLDDTSNLTGGATRAALVVLPPHAREIKLGSLPATSGDWILYSGQGNDLNRTVELRLDMPQINNIELGFDAWWEIEAGWDFAYLETSVDGGETWQRRVTTDRAYMPAKHGHDGTDTLPGFTGLSGDLDGDNKNESNPACDPSKEIAHGEDRVGAEENPCLVPSWVHVRFDLSDLADVKAARIRLRYFTDMAAVMRGIAIDNVTLSGVSLAGDFESELTAPWKLNGFTRNTGHHVVLAAQYYVLEYRDPYAPSTEANHRYDTALAEIHPDFYFDPASKEMTAVTVRPRPGVVVWYFNGEYSWSENDPAINGPGKGYLLVVDSNPNELRLPGLDRWFSSGAEKFNTHYDLSGDNAQKAVRNSYYRTICFVRGRDFMPREEIPVDLKPRGCGKESPPLSKIKVGDKTLMYGYELRNTLLPGPDREPFMATGELVDVRRKDNKETYRLRARTVRYLHTLDAPFSPEGLKDAVVLWHVVHGALKKDYGVDLPAQPVFDDSLEQRWMNTQLPFDGVKVPKTGFTFRLHEPGDDAPEGSQVRVDIQWK